MAYYKRRAGKYGRKNGLRRGWKRGGRGRNKTRYCRHPKLRRRTYKKRY